MPAYSTSHPGRADGLPTLKALSQWVRATYQAPFQNPILAQSASDLERFRRSALLRVISFTITALLLVLTLPALFLVPINNVGLLTLAVLDLAGLLSLVCNARGWITLASATYLYGFLLSIYLYVIFTPYGLDSLTIAVFSLVNIPLFLGELTFTQKALWPNCALVILVSSVILLLVPVKQPAFLELPTSRSALISFFDVSYILTTFLSWVAGRSTRASMTRLAAILEQEQQLVALKDLFIVSANHELRTPIMTLSNNLELVSRTLDRVDPQERNAMVERALRASRDLKDILRNVLDVGVSEAEVSKHLRLESLSVRTVVQQAMDTFDPRELGEPWLEQTTLNTRPVSLDIAPDLLMRADGGRTRQVLVNLLSNALKYSDAASPIAISAHRLESNGKGVPGKPLIPAGSWVQINVRDWGLGVPPHEQPLLFLRFVRLARDAASSTRGTGVGLYLCRLLVQAMGGQIWLESTGIPGQGSLFTFVLPAAQPNV